MDGLLEIGFHSLNVHGFFFIWVRNAPLKAFSRQQHKQCTSQIRKQTIQMIVERDVCGPILLKFILLS